VADKREHTTDEIIVDERQHTEARAAIVDELGVVLVGVESAVYALLKEKFFKVGEGNGNELLIRVEEEID